MVSLKLDNRNNLMFNSNFLTVSENEAVAQDIKNLLLLFKTENPFNLEEGINYYDLANENNRALIEDTIIERILQDGRIKSVKTIVVNFNNMNMNITTQLQLKNGSIINV